MVDKLAPAAAQNAIERHPEEPVLAKPLSDAVRDRAAADPDGTAYLCERGRLTWSAYDHAADEIAGRLAGLDPGERVAVWLPDSPRLHAVYLGCERAGLIVVGIP
ncbi:MAG: AMP-binding protein, partial [Actinobacteria bacterium]|nr:AMP-binding protein [Actinomycetota bacterium]